MQPTTNAKNIQTAYGFGLSKVAINRCKDAGVELFAIGVKQFRELFGTNEYGCHRNTATQAETKRKGAYLFVMAAAEFGHVVDGTMAFGSGTLECALTWLDFFRGSRGANVTVSDYGCFGFECEIWHLVDDDSLWCDWELDVAFSRSSEDSPDFDELAEDAFPFGDCWDSCMDACSPGSFVVMEAQTVAEDLSQSHARRQSVQRHYYGLYCAYGVRTIFDADFAIRFDSLDDLRDWVENDPYDEVDARRERTTLDYIRRHHITVFDYEGV